MVVIMFFKVDFINEPQEGRNCSLWEVKFRDIKIKLGRSGETRFLCKSISNPICLSHNIRDRVRVFLVEHRKKPTNNITKFRMISFNGMNSINQNLSVRLKNNPMETIIHCHRDGLRKSESFLFFHQ